MGEAKNALPPRRPGWVTDYGAVGPGIDSRVECDTIISVFPDKPPAPIGIKNYACLTQLPLSNPCGL